MTGVFIVIQKIGILISLKRRACKDREKTAICKPEKTSQKKSDLPTSWLRTGFQNCENFIPIALVCILKIA